MHAETEKDDADDAAFAYSPSPGDGIIDPLRLAAVWRCGLLDTPRETPFDDLTRLAAVLVDAPLAFTTIVDDRRSFWKSAYGLPADAPRENTVEQSFCQYVVRSRREVVVTDASTDERTRRNPSVEAMGIRAWAGFPLVAPSGHVLGSFCVVDVRPREWTTRDLEVLKTLAQAASREIALREAIASERDARLHAEAVTRMLQASLLPPLLPDIPGMDVAARFRPGGSGFELVGDFYDLFRTAPGRWAFVLGDICGKGIEAAKVASRARHTIGAAAMQHPSPVDVVQFLNEMFLMRGDTIGFFLTAVYGTLVVEETHCFVSLVAAGHAPPILRRSDGSAAPIDLQGPLIGVFSQLEIDALELRLEPGESLIFYTDGISEARCGLGFFGDDAVCEAVASADRFADAATLAHRIEAAALEFCGNAARDDIAVMVLRVPTAAR
jgi:sigma-B regulation protein RsbU (phosphoserine phosphatase)